MPFCTAVTFYSRQGGTDTYKSYAIPQARPRRLGKKEVGLSPEILQRADKVFEFYKNVLDAVGCPAPQVDDYLTDATGQSWTVLDVQGSLNDHCFNCACTRKV